MIFVGMCLYYNDHRVHTCMNYFVLMTNILKLFVGRILLMLVDRIIGYCTF